MWIANAASTGPWVRPDRDVEEPLVEHVLRAAVALLAGLEHEEHPTRQLRPSIDEQPRRAQQHRDVGVVAAGVHRPVDLGGEVEPSVLGQRQGVHVGAEEDRRAGLGAVDQRGDGAEPAPEDRLEPEPLELLDDDRLGDRQIGPDLRVAMDPAADRHDVGQQRAGVGEQGREVGRKFGRHQGASMKQPGVRLVAY